ncbi:IclR family transcriptional regulator [Neobacillus niacini]|uniref:IclR family transcriptional regulator n=1 Tax=Neobacillus niacini TaxID=86668 RepID=UPI00300180CF
MLKTLDLALKIIQMFTNEKKEWGGRELAQALGMDHAKIYRILQTFEANNFIKQDPITKKYSLGFAVLELGMTMYNGIDMRQFLKPPLQKLCELTGESTFLTILDKDEGVTVEVNEPENKVKFSVSVGSRSPLYVGASYRSILAFMTDDYIENYLKTYELKQYTENTMAEPGVLREELLKIKEQGYAISQGEYTPDVLALAIPVFSAHQGVKGSITVSGPTYRLTREKILSFLPLLIQIRNEVEEISEKYHIHLKP